MHCTRLLFNRVACLFVLFTLAQSAVYESQTSVQRTVYGPQMLTQTAVYGPQTLAQKSIYGPQTMAQKSIYGPQTMAQKSIYGPQTMAQKSIYGPQCPIRKVITYNTALLDMDNDKSRNRLERRDAITSELRRLDADVVCLQEVWLGEDVEFILQNLNDVYVHSWSKLHINGKLQCQATPRKPPCELVAATNFMSCCQQNRCYGKRLKMHESARCIALNCLFEFTQLSQKCISCVVVSFQGPNIAMAKCAGNGFPAVGMRSINGPGILLLSKLPLTNYYCRDYHPYTKECIERGFLEVDVHSLGKVVCTHNTNNVMHYLEPELWIRGIFMSTLEQGFAERSQLIARFRHTNPLILMGDFNVGEMFAPNIVPDIPHEFNRLARYFDIVPLRQCSICWEGENPYTHSSRGLVNTVVDHIFYKGHNVQEVVRVFAPLEAMLLNNLPLSDHYGVMAIIKQC